MLVLSHYHTNDDDEMVKYAKQVTHHDEYLCSFYI